MSPSKADLILHGAHIRTMDPARPRAEALAIAQGRVLAVGNEADIMALAGPGTRMHNLHGRAVLPGFIDSHTHGLWGAARDLFEVYAGLGAPLQKLLDLLAARVARTPPGEWICGGPWRAHARAELGENPAALLDRIAPDHPVALRETTQHSLWLNSAGLRLAGITAATPDPAGGRIERDGAGNPTGILEETAMALALPLIDLNPARRAEAARHMAGYFHRMGLTGFKEPMAFEEDLIAYGEADAAGMLNLHVGAHLSRSAPFGPGLVAMETLADWRHRYGRGHLHTGFAKLFLDGVAPSHTAAFVDPYLPAPGYDPAAHDPDAMLLIPPAELAREVTALDAAGFTVKMHAVGDRAVQAALDAIAAARTANGDSGLRHEIAHAPFIQRPDIARFAELGAVAEVSPKLWFPNPVTEGQRAVLGNDRVERCHPINDLLRAGAEVVYGSDWPAAAADANPWPGLAGMISRRDPLGRFAGQLGADQAIGLDAALNLFTRNSARALRLEHLTGQISAGFSADLVVLAAPLETLSPEEIGAIEPLATLFEGRVVHGTL